MHLDQFRARATICYSHFSPHFDFEAMCTEYWSGFHRNEKERVSGGQLGRTLLVPGRTLAYPPSVIIVVPWATIAIPWFPLYLAGTSPSSRTHAPQFWHSQVDFTCSVSNYPLHIIKHRILRHGIRHFTFAMARWGREEQRHNCSCPPFISSVRSSYSHPDLLLTQHQHPTFSDHTGPQHWTFTFWATTAI